jgi:GntR family transcriptional repressor for pyruvate dehydrogenase complex
MTAAIVAGEFSPGQRLPPERELAARFGVSRNVVREAVNELRSRGLLETRQGSGSVVTDNVHKPVSDLLGTMLTGQTNGEAKLLELRAALEIDVARLAAERATEDEIAELQRILDAYTAAGQNVDACAELDIEFHRALVRASHNDLFGLVLASVDELLVKSRKAALRRSGVGVAAESHQKIFDAVKRRTASEAMTAMDEHLAITKDHLVKERR